MKNLLLGIIAINLTFISAKIVLMDMQTANAIMKVHKALNGSNRKKYEKLSISKMADVAWKLIK